MEKYDSMRKIILQKLKFCVVKQKFLRLAMLLLPVELF